MIHNMQRIQVILSHPLFCESLHKIQELERDRIYCKHGLPHRRGDTAQMLGRILCEADDASRMCFACAAQDTCYWPEHRKNNTILL